MSRDGQPRNAPGELTCTLPFRARHARFDRPAGSLVELLQADGEDFVHLAAWTLLDRRATPAEHAAWLAGLNGGSQHAKADLIATLAGLATAAGNPPQLSGLNNYLLLHELRGKPVVGSMLSGLTALHLAHPGFSWPARFVRSVPGKIRYTYRHSRKLLYKLAGRMQVPNPVEMRLALGRERAAAPDDAGPIVVDYYQRLIAAVDGRERAD